MIAWECTSQELHLVRMGVPAKSVYNDTYFAGILSLKINHSWDSILKEGVQAIGGCIRFMSRCEVDAIRGVSIQTGS